MKMNFLVLLVSVASATAFADILLLEPKHLSCSIDKIAPYYRCNLSYDNLVIHEGRAEDQITANGDFVKCTTLIEKAVQSNMHLAMRRSDLNNYFSWGQEFFLTLVP